MIRPPPGTNDTRIIIRSVDYEQALAEEVAQRMAEGLDAKAAERLAREYLDANYEVDDEYCAWIEKRGIVPAAAKAEAQ